VYFDLAKETLDQKEIHLLDSILNTLHEERDYIVKLVGHTDSIGGLQYNQILSKKRATYIQDYLHRKSSRFSATIDWKAYTAPAQSNVSKQGRANNRRVEIFFEKIPLQKDKWEIQSQVFELNNSKSYLLHSDNGCKFTLGAGSFKADPKDTIQVRITAYNDPADFLAGGLPMSYTRGQKEFAYQSEKMIKIEAFNKNKPIELLYKIGFECPDIEVKEGLRLYKFNGTNESFVDIVTKEYPGIMEEIETDVKEHVINKVSKNKNTEEEISPPTENKDKLKPDTTRKAASATINRSFLTASPIPNCDSVSQFNNIMKRGRKLLEWENTIDFQQDFNSYTIRYNSFKYDGMLLKCRKNNNDLNAIRTSTKKRFLRKQLLLKINETPQNSEYLPLKNTTWIVHYGKDAKKLSKIKNISANDFIISKSKKNYFIEFKGEQEFVKFLVKPKKKRKTAPLFKEYRKHYLTRVKTFDDSIATRLEKTKIPAHFDFYNLLYTLNGCTNLDLNLGNKIPPNQNKDKQDCTPPRTKEDKYFIDWLIHINNNSEKIQAVIEEIEKKPAQHLNCLCDTLTISPPVLGKWSYANTGVSDNKIIFIGLGIYNLDYVFELEKKQVISNPLFVTVAGDTVLKCWSNTIDRAKQSAICKQQVFTVIPKFNGLLQHNLGNQLSLLKEKENILFLTTPYKRYKCYIDLRNQKKFTGKTFIVEEITQQTKTVDGLRKELEKTKEE
jgi:hypothetical protein